VFHPGVIDRTSGGRAETVSGAETFEAFFDAEHRRLYRSLVLITGDRQEADDVAQEAMVRVLERWDRVEGMDDPRAYLYRTALNLNRNRHRWTARRRASPKEREQAPDPAESIAEALDVRRALSMLTSDQRVALVLVDFLGFDSGAAGTIVGIDREAIRARLHRGRTTLRQELSKDG